MITDKDSVEVKILIRPITFDILSVLSLKVSAGKEMTWLKY